MNSEPLHEEKLCKHCRHFRQHYIRFGWRYEPVNCGHCVYPRRKTRRPDDTCARWTAREGEVVDDC